MNHLNFDVLETNNKTLKKEFFNFPWKHYQLDPHWVSPLRISIKGFFDSSHPFCELAEIKTFVAKKKDGTILGRIAAIHYKKETLPGVGYFGFFECVDDQIVADKLFDAAKKYLSSQGLSMMQGPVNPSTNYECGCLVEGFEGRPQIMMPYNPPYYQKLYEKAGFTKAMDLLAYNIAVNIKLPEKIESHYKFLLNSSSINFRYFNKKQFSQEVDLLRELYNECWNANWGFIPMSQKEFNHLVNEIKTIFDPELCIFAYVGDKPAGFVCALPDFNQVFSHIPSGRLFPTGIFKLFRARKYINRARILLGGFKEEFRTIGLGPLLYVKMKEQLIKKGCYRDAEISWVLETNTPMNESIKIMGVEAYRTYRIYEINLAETK